MTDFSQRLDNLDGRAVGVSAVGYRMYEDALEIYKKFNLKDQDIKVRGVL